tara:strand:- start:25287 stop:25697 length:411 start_codon:yes stop_codon:yes gene_type:complete
MNPDLQKALAAIQQKLKAPKSQQNKFGGYKYRSCEDILEAVKPLIGSCTLTISDSIKQIGERFYIESTCTLYGFGDSIAVTAYAREALDKKGMDVAQISGAASSYSRKYSLNGMFLIDDTADSDASEPEKTGPPKR